MAEQDIAGHVITLGDVYGLLVEVRDSQVVVKAAIDRLESTDRDHEKRIRDVEARSDQARRVDRLEEKISDALDQVQHSQAKQGERIGRIEQMVSDTKPVKVHVSTWVAIVMSGLAVVTTIILFSIGSGGQPNG